MTLSRADRRIFKSLLNLLDPDLPNAGKTPGCGPWYPRPEIARALVQEIRKRYRIQRPRPRGDDRAAYAIEAMQNMRKAAKAKVERASRGLIYGDRKEL